MDEIYFDQVNEYGFTIYRMCFDQFVNVKFYYGKKKTKWSKLIPKQDDIFFMLVKLGQEKLGVDIINKVIEKPDQTGTSCFGIATQCSPKIAKYILSQNIKINTIVTDMFIPSFEIPDLTEDMMKKNINPKFINCEGDSEIEQWPNNFKSSACQNLLKKFPREIHFSVENTECKITCKSDCQSKLEAFFFKNGPIVNISDVNKLGYGGFGSVYAGKWHDEDVACKCVLIDGIEWTENLEKTVSEFEKNISEYRLQLVAHGSGIVIPYAMIRQQNQEYKHGKWNALNFNVFIYPKYDCNLYELHQSHNQRFTDSILTDILDKCLIRK